MADNSIRTPGSGETIASDDVGGVKFQRVKLTAGPDGTAVDVLNPADAMVAANSGILPTATQLFNETTFDRQRGNTTGSLLASAARTTSTTTAIQTNYNARGAFLILNITAASGTGGLQVAFIGNATIASGYYLNAAAAAIIATGSYAYELYPAATTVTGTGSGFLNGRTSGSLPRLWSAQVIHGNASSYTYSLEYMLIL